MNYQSVTDILLSLKTLVGEEAFQQSLSALSAKPEKSSAFGIPKQWANTVQQTADRLNALPASGTASGDALPKKKGGRPTKAQAEARLAAMTPEERLQAEAKKAEAKAKRAAKKAEVSDSASVASATEAVTEAASASASASGTASGETSETGSKKKAGRPKMTEEQKAEAKAKREAKKAAKAAEPAEPEASALEGEWAEMAEALESE